MRKEIVVSVIEPGLDELKSIWDYVGYAEEQRTEKLHSLAEKLQAPLFDFISAENQFRVDLDADIESRKRRAAQICQSLRLPPYFPPRGLPSLQLQQHLEQHIAQFELAIAERRERLQQLQATIRALCDCMQIQCDATVLEQRLIDADEDKEFIPTESDLEKLQEASKQLECRLESMKERFRLLAEDIRRIAADIERTPDTDFESAILNNDETSLKFSEPTLESMESLRLSLVKQKAMLVGTCDELRQHVSQMWTRLGIPQEEQQEFLLRHSGYSPSCLEALQEESEKCQELKWSQLATYISNLRAEAKQLSEACFLADSAEIGNDHDDSDCSEESVAAIERRIDELRESFEQNKELYAAVSQYHVTWNSYVEAEQKMKDPAILSNRGGVLLKTDRDRKQLLKELPKVSAKVTELLEQLGGSDFRIQGRSFQQHVEHLWKEFKNQKEAAKFSRKASSATSLESSAISSSSCSSTSSPRKSLNASAAAAAASKR